MTIADLLVELRLRLAQSERTNFYTDEEFYRAQGREGLLEQLIEMLEMKEQL
jgi:hypothetical protein